MIIKPKKDDSKFDLFIETENMFTNVVIFSIIVTLFLLLMSTFSGLFLSK